MNPAMRSQQWLGWLILGCGLLLADLGNSILLTGSIGGALQQRAIVPEDMVLASLAALAMTSSQLWFFSHVQSATPVLRDRVMVLVLPGVVLNCAANFFVIAGGRPSADLIAQLEGVLATSTQTFVGQSFLAFAFLLAMLMSFLPEFLIARGWHERVAR